MELPPPGLDRRDFLKTVALAGGAAALSGCNSTKGEPVSASSLPFRTVEQALSASRVRQFFAHFSTPSFPTSPLEIRLKTSRSEPSKTGLANGHVFEFDEVRELGNLTFAFNPWHYTVSNGEQIIPIFANTPDFTEFRRDHTDALTRVFDRTIWAIHKGQRVTAVVETDKEGFGGFPPGLKVLLEYGIKSFIIGNEPNGHDANKDVDPGQVIWIARTLRELASSLNIDDIEISAPGLAHFGSGEYLLDIIQCCKNTSEPFPFDRIPDHFYGPAEELPSRVDLLQRNKIKYGIGNLPYDLTEVGNLEEVTSVDDLSDWMIASGRIPQIFSRAATLADVGRVYWYSALDWGQEEHSLLKAEGGKLIPKTSFRAYSVITKLLEGVTETTTIKDRGYTQVMGRRKDGTRFSVVWTGGKDELFLTDSPDDLPYNAIGEPVPINGRKINLHKSQAAGVEGDAVIILHAA